MRWVSAVLIIGVALAGSHWAAYRAGRTACEEAHRLEVVEQQQRDAGQVLEIIQSDVAREIRYVTKEVRIKEQVDDCLDRPMPDDVVHVLGGMQPRDGGAPRPRIAQGMSSSGS